MTTFGPYFARVVAVTDGDTCVLDLDLGFGVGIFGRSFDGRTQLSCRVYGINAPERFTDVGKAALAYAATLLPVGLRVTILSHFWDKFGGRFDGEIKLPDGRDFGAVMLAAGHAVPFMV